MAETFEPGELFIYEKAPGVYELGVTKRQRDERTWFCYYSMGDTAAATPAPLMNKLVNAKWAPIQWSNVWGGPVIMVGDLIKLVPGGHKVFVSDSDDNGEGSYYFEGRATDLPGEYMNLQVVSVTAYDGQIDIEVCDA